MAKKDKGKKKQALTTNPAQQPKAKSQVKTTFNYQLVLFPVILAILTYVSFAPSNDNGFTNWDDPVYVVENTMIQKAETQWNEIFSKPVSNNYHPLTMLTLAWNYQSQATTKPGAKIDAKVFHEWNVWLHVFNTVLVFFFIWLLTGGQLIATVFTAAIFGIHPMHVESVSWISERKDVLYTFFFLLSCICYLLYLALCFILFGLSCLSKAMAVVLPVVLFTIDYLKSRKWEWRILVEKIPFLLLSLFIGLKAYHVQQASIADAGLFSLFQRMMFGSYGAVMYLVKFFVPYQLSTFYPYPSLPIPSFYYVTPVIWLVLAALVWYGHKRFRPLSFGILFFVINVALVLQFMSVGSAIMADRYTYISYIGIAFIIGALCNLLIKKYPASSIPVYAICAGFVLFLATQTYARTAVWKNSGTLWTDVMTNYPSSEVAYKNRGLWYKEQGDVDHMYIDYMVLKRMNTKDSRVYSNMGNIYGMRGKTDSAMWAYNMALKYDPKNEDAYINRGITYSMMKEYDKAIEDYNIGEKIMGPSITLFQNRGYTYLASGKYQQSLEDYTKLLQLRPYDGQSYFNRAVVEEQLNKNTEAYSDLQTAVSQGYKVEEAELQRMKTKAGK